MEQDSILKIDYLYNLRFKHLENICYIVDVELNLTIGESIRFLREVRECVRNRDTNKLVNIGDYEISITSDNENNLTISVMELKGSMSKSLGTFTYDSYMGGKSIISGIISAISEIDSY